MSEKEWLEKLRKSEDFSWCSDDQWECCQMIFDLVGGEHHLQNKIKSFGMGIGYTTSIDFSTFDFNLMTIAVFMAHDRCIRLSVHSATKKRIKLCLWKRKGREGRISERHPTLEKAIEDYRKYYPVEE